MLLMPCTQVHLPAGTPAPAHLTDLLLRELDRLLRSCVISPRCPTEARAHLTNLQLRELIWLLLRRAKAHLTDSQLPEPT